MCAAFPQNQCWYFSIVILEDYKIKKYFFVSSMVAKYLPDLWGLDSIALFLFMNKKTRWQDPNNHSDAEARSLHPWDTAGKLFFKTFEFELEFLFGPHSKHAENFSKEIWQVQAILHFKKQFQVASIDILQNRPCKIQNAALIFTDGKHCYLRSLTKQESNRYLRNGQ